MENNILINTLAHISKNSSIVKTANIEKLYHCFEQIVEKKDLLQILGFISSNSLDINWDKLSDKSRRNILNYMKNNKEDIIYKVLIKFKTISDLITTGKTISKYYCFSKLLKNNSSLFIALISLVLSIIVSIILKELRF
jgi:hypothetical protein